MRLTRLALCGFLLHAAPAAAVDEASRFAMKGAGLLPCQLYLAEREKRSNVYYMIGGWIEGYVSAYNRLTAETYDVLSFESLELVLAVMETHCRSNPGDPLHAVIASMIRQMAPDRLRSESSKAEVVVEERRTVLYRETIRRTQSKLTELGLYRGEIDGRFSEDTRSAVIAFQSDLELETTGFPDQTTLWRLLR